MPSTEPESSSPFSLSSLVLPFYLPSGFAFLGVGLAAPLLALYARHLGMANSGAAFIVGLVGLGSLLFNIPAGQLMLRYGMRRAVIVATSVEACAAAVAGLLRVPGILGAMAFVTGMTQTTFFVARLAYFRNLVPSEKRGRALSLIGGENRLGYFIGPIAGGFLAQTFGFRYAFFAYAALMALASLFLFLWAPSTERPASSESWKPAQSLSLLRENARTFATAGVAIITLQLMRTARQALVPLVAHSLGLSVSQIGMIIGLMFFVEILLVYPVGHAMDRLGRKAVALPCLVFLSLGLALLPFVHSVLMMIVAVVVAGIGNGLGSGINMTLSTDFAPARNPSRFIGMWRFVVDLGTMSGPFIVGLIAAVLSLGGAAFIVASVGFGGAAVMGFLVPEPRPRSGRKME
ncbi:MAG TPA: MFS transporter [Rectinemataceae bacterium]|nr:MFS transporter [Rectinemataceae bacterium]